MYLLDTNVLSELRKGPRCHPNVAAWIQPIPASELFLSVIVLGEVRKGVELLARRDAMSAAKLTAWLNGLYVTYSDRLLAVTATVADEWGRLNARRPLASADSLLGATAIVHGLVLVTRNISDLRGTGVRMLNPFETPHVVVQ